MGRPRSTTGFAWGMRAVAICAIVGLVWMVETLAPSGPPGLETLLSLHVPEDVDGLGGLDLARLRRSEFGEQLITRVRSAEDSLDVQFALADSLPVESLHAVVFAGWVSPGDSSEGFVVLSGSFDARGVLSALKGLHGVDAVESSVEGMDCVGHRSESHVAAVISENILYLGSRARLEAVNNVRMHRAPSAWRGSRRRIIRESVGRGAMLWGVGSLAEGLSLGSGASTEENELFRSVREAGVSVRLGTSASVRIWAIPDSPQSGARMVSWLKRTRAIFALIAGKLDESGRLKSVLDQLQLEDTGDAVTLTVEVSSTQLRGWVESGADGP